MELQKTFFVFTKRSFLVEIGAFLSPTVPISCGVPQGYVLGPTFFSLYMLLLHDIFEVSYQAFADDIQLNLTLKSGTNFLSPLLACLSDIKSWIDKNFLQPSENKNDIMLFCPSQLSGRFLVNLSSKHKFISLKTLEPF